MTAVIFGTGHIGCGFAGQLFAESGHDLVFVGRNRAMIDHLNRVGRYAVRLVHGPLAVEVPVEGVRAVDLSETERVAEAVAAADVVATAVGAAGLPVIAPALAAGLDRARRPRNVLAFENLPAVSGLLRRLVTRQSRTAPRHGFAGALVTRMVTRHVGGPGQDEPLTFVGDLPSTFMVDAAGLTADLPEIAGMTPVGDYEAHVRHKLFVFSAGHATAAYLGHLKGYHYVHTAMCDDEVRRLVHQAMREGQRGLAALYGHGLAGDRAERVAYVARFENAGLEDPVERVGRDPIRKLAGDDRLIGPATLAWEAGVPPHALALSVAAALHFDAPADPSAARLRRDVRLLGLRALRSLCPLDPDTGLGQTVSTAWGRLTGDPGGGLLLSLEQGLWAWAGAPEPTPAPVG